MKTQAARNQITWLSMAQIFTLHVASHYKLKRSSMGWWAENHLRWDVSEPVVILRPVTIKALWRKGLLDGNPDFTILGTTRNDVHKIPLLWTNERGKEVLIEIERDTGIFYDIKTDRLVSPSANFERRTLH